MIFLYKITFYVQKIVTKNRFIINKHLNIVTKINYMATASTYTTQKSLLLQKLIAFYKENNYLDVILPIINGEGKMSLRLIDWFVTNYAKKNFIVYYLKRGAATQRFKVYTDYKLKLKAYSKKRFDPFCRWERITIPYDDDNYIQTTIGQLNFSRIQTKTV